MNIFRHLTTLTVLFAFFCFVFPQEAYAYLDPGTGSYLLQVGLAVLLGASFVIKIYWRRIRASLANLFSKRKKDGKNSN